MRRDTMVFQRLQLIWKKQIPEFCGWVVYIFSFLVCLHIFLWMRVQPMFWEFILSRIYITVKTKLLWASSFLENLGNCPKVTDFSFQALLTCPCLILLPVPICEFFSHHQAMLQHQLGVLQCNSVPTPSTWKEHHISGVRAQPHKTALTSDANLSPDCHLYFWPSGYGPEGPTAPSLGPTDLLEWLRGIFYLLGYWLVVKGDHSGTARWQTHGASYGEGGKEPPCFLRTPLPLYLHVLINPETLWTPAFGAFMEAWWCRHDWWSHWPSAVNSTSSPISKAGGGESSKPLTTRTAPLATSPPPLSPYLWSHSLFIHISSSAMERSLFRVTISLDHSQHWGHSKGLRSSVPATGTMAQYLYFYKSQHRILSHPPPKSPWWWSPSFNACVSESGFCHCSHRNT